MRRAAMRCRGRVRGGALGDAPGGASGGAPGGASRRGRDGGMGVRGARSPAAGMARGGVPGLEQGRARVGLPGFGRMGSARRQVGVGARARGEGGELAAAPEFDRVRQPVQQPGQGGQDEEVQRRHQPGAGARAGVRAHGGGHAGGLRGQGVGGLN
ncbi:MAG: hypothetical protein IT555_15080 [Acetobacteraceae bacterium]|nr:hypothetical protein [Acetobacteraceae bacterium]